MKDNVKEQILKAMREAIDKEAVTMTKVISDEEGNIGTITWIKQKPGCPATRSKIVGYAMNEGLSREKLTALCNHEDYRVRMIAATNPSISRNDIGMLLEDENELVRAVASVILKETVQKNGK